MTSPTPAQPAPVRAASPFRIAVWLESAGESRWFFPATLAVTLVILFSNAVGPDCLFAYRDSAHFYPPLYKLVREEWLAGRVPLWNPLLNNGQPLAGMATSGAFYPPQVLLTMLLPDGLSLNVHVIAHLALAATGAYLLGRYQGLSRPAATLAGLAYAFGGSVLFQVYNPIYACGAAWLVWAVFGGVRLLAGGGTRDFLLLSVALAMSVLCGEPQAGYHAGLVLGLWWLFLPARTWRGLATLAAAAGAAAFLSLVQIALAAEFARETSRSMDLAPQSLWQVPGFLLRADHSPERAQWFDILIGRPPKVAGHYRSAYGFVLQPWRIVEFFWPQFAGPPHARWTINAGFDTPVTWVNSLYAGILPAVAALAVCWPAGQRRLVPRVWLWLLGLSLLASMGAYGLVGVVRHAVAIVQGDWAACGYRDGDEVGGLYWLLSIAAPGYSGFRYPVKWMTVWSLAFGQVAGFAIDTVATTAMRQRLARLTGATAVLAVFGLAALVVAAAIRGIDAVLPCANPAETGAFVWRVVVGGGVHVVVVSALLWWLCRATLSLSPTSCVAVLAMVSACDIAAAGHRELLVGRFSDLVRGGLFLEELKQTRRPELAAVSPRLRIAVQSENLIIIDTRDLGRFVPFTGMMMRSHVPWLFDCEKFGEVSTAMPADVEALCSSLTDAAAAVLPRRTFDLASVEFFLVPMAKDAIANAEAFLRDWSDGQKRGEYQGPAPQGGNLPVVELPLPGGGDSSPVLIVARNESAIPRVRIVREVRTVVPVAKQSWDRWVDTLKRIAFPNPGVPDLFTRALVETDAQTVAVFPQQSPVGTPPPVEDSCQMTVDESQRVVVTAELAEPGLVVLADTFHPDWTLTVASDGAEPRPLPIQRVNRIHRGCSLPAGRHVLEFRYHSKTFARTIWITLAAWGAAAGALVRVRPTYASKTRLVAASPAQPR